ncbi:probable serine carboxypeptidase CPVL [Paramacrobiotus metropolitanus]|uniref:probable serine carboxypeptidase CPVL n=1 Tax=Paramacrobiotus metropolitanus TaxID=2943436 RepID=UPI002445DE15|nr:probable serine carboxypeptidase CPVL [Paramacrobiotus metropolitanus]
MDVMYAALIYNFLTLVVTIFGSSSSEINGKPWRPENFKSAFNKCDHLGEPLILTPYIKAGDIKRARQLSTVHLPFVPAVSHSGFLTVNETDNGNMFFWFFPAEIAEPELAPVVVWLQGGPGATSMFGLFVEHGPFYLQNSIIPLPRPYRWTKLANMLYIDNPVGTGFSFTNTTDGYSRNQKQVSMNLYEALLQFYTMFPQFQTGELYITGESYAGKYVPSLAYRIHVSNWNATLQLPLAGIAIGNGLVDPANMFHYGDMLYQFGMIDELQRDYFHTQEDAFRIAVSDYRFHDAFLIFDSLLNGDKISYPTYFYNATHSEYYFNILRTTAPPDFGYYNKYLEQCDVRQAINVGNQTFANGSLVEDFLLEDIPQSVRTKLETLADNYKVLIYNGQLDIICGLPLTENYINQMDWSGADAYKTAKKIIWKVDDTDKEVAGYVRQVNKFFQVAVRNGGHMLPYDQPRATFDMLRRFLFGKPFVNRGKSASASSNSGKKSRSKKHAH